MRSTAVLQPLPYSMLEIIQRQVFVSSKCHRKVILSQKPIVGVASLSDNLFSIQYSSETFKRDGEVTWSLFFQRIDFHWEDELSSHIKDLRANQVRIHSRVFGARIPALVIFFQLCYIFSLMLSSWTVEKSNPSGA